MARRTGELDMHSREWGREVWYSPQTQAAKWTPRLSPEAARRWTFLSAWCLWPALL